MRAIGQLPDEHTARRFGDYLLVQRIPNQVEPDDTGRWTVWIHEDDQLTQAQALLEDYVQEPDAPRYRKAAPGAQQLRAQEQAEEKAWRKRFHDRRGVWRGAAFQVGWLTASLTAMCVGVAMVKYLQGGDSPLVHALRITDFTAEDGMMYYMPGLPEVRSGQVWRLLTPVFLHFGVLHLVFNLMWLLSLGGQIEARLGVRKLAIMVAVIGSVSNVAQYLVGGPAFGGMSGVIYGLFGYIWVRSKMDPRSGLYIDPTSVTLMVVWFFICLSGWMPVANMAHGAGFALGLAWAYVASKLNE